MWKEMLVLDYFNVTVSKRFAPSLWSLEQNNGLICG